MWRSRSVALATVFIVLLGIAPSAPAAFKGKLKIGEMPKNNDTYTHVRPQTGAFTVSGRFKFSNVAWSWSQALGMYRAQGRVCNAKEPDVYLTTAQFEFFSSYHKVLFSDTVYVGNIATGGTRSYGSWMPGLSMAGVSYIRVSVEGTIIF